MTRSIAGGQTVLNLTFLLGHLTPRFGLEPDRARQFHSQHPVEWLYLITDQYLTVISKSASKPPKSLAKSMLKQWHGKKIPGKRSKGDENPNEAFTQGVTAVGRSDRHIRIRIGPEVPGWPDAAVSSQPSGLRRRRAPPPLRARRTGLNG